MPSLSRLRLRSTSRPRPAANTPARDLRPSRARRRTLAVLATTALAGASFAAPAAQASTPASWAAEKLAGGVAGGAGSAAFGAGLAAIGLDAQTNQLAAIRRDLAEIKRQLTAISAQLDQLSAQLAQHGCNTTSHQLGDVRSTAVDAWERYETLLARGTEAARAAGLPAMRKFLDDNDFRALRKRVHTALTSPGAGAESFLKICGSAVERTTYPFLSTITTARVRAFLDDWQMVQVRLSAMAVEQQMLAGDPDGAAEEAASLGRDLAAQDKLLPKAMPVDVALDVRTNLVWSRTAEAITYNAIRGNGTTFARTPTDGQMKQLLAGPCCTVGGSRVSRQKWLEQQAGVDFKTFLSRRPPMAGLWVTTPTPAYTGLAVVAPLTRDVPLSTKNDMLPLKAKETHVLLRVRPRTAGEDWSVGQSVCLAEGQASSRAAGQTVKTPRGRKTVRRVGRTWYGTPAGDTITTGARATVHAGKGPDVITVGSRSLVYGGGCNDVIHVKGSGSVIHGGKDHDTVRVLGGSTTVYGGHGDDDLRGGRGSDRISGGAGNDAIDGGAGDDTLTGGTGRDTIHGGTGNDRINARDGERDIVDCGPGRDVAIVDREDVVRNCERVVRD